MGSKIKLHFSCDRCEAEFKETVITEEDRSGFDNLENEPVASFSVYGQACEYVHLCKRCENSLRRLMLRAAPIQRTRAPREKKAKPEPDTGKKKGKK